MNISTRLKKEVAPELLFGGAEQSDESALEIVFIVDCYRQARTHSLDLADKYHKSILADGCTYLPKESPVINGFGECILHYTSTTYKEWCNR